MKKICFISILFSILCTSVFAAKVTVSPVKTSYNEISTDVNGNLRQTVISDSGMEITIGAELENDTLKYTVELANISDPSFLQKNNSIKTYVGNIEKDEWVENTTSAFSKNKTSNSTSSDSDASIAEALVFAGATCLCAFTVFEICNSMSSSSGKAVSARSTTTVTKRTPARTPEKKIPSSRSPSVRTPSQAPSRVNPAPSVSWIIIDPIIVTPTVRIERNTETRRNQLDNYVDERLLENEDGIIVEPEVTPQMTRYSGTFYVPTSKGPDYRIRVIVSENEYIDFYFSRSDRDNVANPLKDRNYGRHSILLSLGVPDITKIGVYYMYSPKYVGIYAGASVKIDSFNATPFLGYSDKEYTTPFFIYDTNGVSSFEFEKNSARPTYTDIINLTLGLTIKTIPHTWLMLGCGVDMDFTYYYGNLYSYDEGTREFIDSGYIQSLEPIFNVVPQVGVSLIFDHLNIAGTCQYAVQKEQFSFDVMVGFAF